MLKKQLLIWNIGAPNPALHRTNCETVGYMNIKRGTNADSTDTQRNLADNLCWKAVCY